MPNRLRRPSRRPVARVAVAVLAALLLVAGCGSDGAESGTLEDLGIVDDPEDVVASALIAGDPTRPIGTEHLKLYIQRRLVPSGWSWADARCAADTTERIVGVEEFANLPFYKSESLAADHEGLTEAVEECASPETNERRNNTVTEHDITIVARIPGPDPDPNAIAELERGFFERGAEIAGLTSAELECVHDGMFGSWTDEDWVARAQGSRRVDAADVADVVEDCLDDDRLDEAAVKAGRVLLTAREFLENLQSTTTTEP